MLADRTTLTQFLIEQRRRHPEASGDLNALILDVALACRAIAKAAAHGALHGVLGRAGRVGARGEAQRLDIAANDLFRRATEWDGTLAGLVSEDSDQPHAMPEGYPRGKYLLAFDPLDGFANVDVNGAVGSIFSILRAATPGVDAVPADFLQPGTRQVCAGYAIYGTSTMLVVTVGTGAHGFTLDPGLGEFILTHPSITIPAATCEFAIDASNHRFWEPAVRRYIDECLAGTNGPRGKNFNMRWTASLVAEAHRILMRGGVVMYPQDGKHPVTLSRLRLMCEASPIALLVEQAGGAASTGRQRVLDILPGGIHQRVPFVFGSRDEVERIERYYRDHNTGEYDAPLFGERGLFRASA